jgi:hypothetical protein
MKKTLAFIFFCLAFTVFIDNAYSKPKEKLQFRKEMLWHLAALPAYAFLQLNIHEGSHALMALAVGAKIVSYCPYPHVYTYDGRHYFVYGSTLITDVKTKNREAMIDLVPYLSDLSIFTITDLLISFGAVNPHSFFGGTLYFVGMVMPFMDFVINVNGYSKQNDFSHLADCTGIHRAMFGVVGNIIAAVAIWRLISVGKKVFFRKKTQKNLNAYFAPMWQIAPFATNVVGRGISMSVSF